MSFPAQETSAAGAGLHRSDDPKSYRSNANFVYSSKNTAPVLALLDAQAGDVILDLGCGSGELTQFVASNVQRDGGKGSVLGVDASADMIEAAQESSKSAGVASSTLRYDVADGCDLSSYLQREGVVGCFDRVFSNAAIHWMKLSPQNVVKGVYEALKPGGVFAAELGGFMNIIGLRGACHHVVRKHGVDPNSVDPWFFPTPEAYRHLLTSPELPTPFDVINCELVPRPTLLPNGVRSFFETFCGPFLNALPSDEAREEAMKELEDILRPDMYDPYTDTWTAMYVRLRVKAVKAGGNENTAKEEGFVVTPAQGAKVRHSATSPEAVQAVQTLQTQFLNRSVLVHIPDGRVFSGIFTCVDDGMNLVLSQAEEWRLRHGQGDTEARVSEKRMVGMAMIKGEDIVKLEVKSSGDSDDDRAAAAISAAFGGPSSGSRSSWPTDPDAYA